MYHIKRHAPEKLFVSGSNTVIMPLTFKPYTVIAKFIDAEAIRLPGCNPLVKDSVAASIIQLPEDDANGDPLNAIQISWTVTGTREIEWLVTELTS